MLQGSDGVKRNISSFKKDGSLILVGRSDVDNDFLTFNVMQKDDLWLHVQGYAGSHVLIVVENKNYPSKEVIAYAASLAHRYSKAKDMGFVDVHIANKEAIKKAKGAPAGEVWIDRYKVIRTHKNKFKDVLFQ